MADSTAVFHDASEAFRSSVFYLSPNSSQTIGDTLPLWTDSPFYKILVAVTIILFLANLKNLYYCLPDSLKACFRTKTALLIETRPSLRKSRSLSAYISILIIAVILSKLGYSAYVAVFIISREVIYLLSRIKTKNPELKYAHSCILNFYIPLALISFASYGIMYLCSSKEETIGTVLLYIGCAVWLMVLHRERQFFKLFCSSFSSFLYLCALEILPIALTVVWVK